MTYLTVRKNNEVVSFSDANTDISDNAIVHYDCTPAEIEKLKHGYIIHLINGQLKFIMTEEMQSKLEISSLKSDLQHAKTPLDLQLIVGRVIDLLK